MKVSGNEKEYSLCPLCTVDGSVICPEGFEAKCAGKNSHGTKPKCIFLGNKYVPGCWKYVGIEKLDLSFLAKKFPPSLMVEVVGGGEKYTLNREIVKCGKI